MADHKTLARPYAKALLALAQEKNELALWGDNLQVLSDLIQHPDMQYLLANASLSTGQLAGAIIDMLSVSADGEVGNLIKLLAHYRRLGLLPNIAEVYDKLRQEAENSLKVSMRSAVNLSDSQQQTYAKKLSQRFGKQVAMECEVDPNMMGGYKVAINDLVIDGSIRERLQRMQQHLDS